MANDKILQTARYVEGDMDDKESLAYETQLAADPELQQYLANYREINLSLAMQFADNTALKEVLAPLNGKYFVARQKVPIWKWLSRVAAVLLFGLLIWAPWRAKNLADKYAINAKMEIVERGNTNEDLETEVANYFNQGNFKKALPLLEKLHKAHPEDAFNTYFYAITLAKTHKTTQAINLFENLFAGNSVYKEDAAYQLAIIYLQQKNNAQAKKWLAKISPENLRYEAAQEIINELK